MNNKKILFFHIAVEFKILCHPRGGQITNFKENYNLKQNNCLWCLLFFRNSDKRKLHRRTFDPSIKRQIYSMCPENVFGYQRSCYKLINKWKRDHLKNFQSVDFCYKRCPQPIKGLDLGVVKCKNSTQGRLGVQHTKATQAPL